MNTQERIFSETSHHPQAFSSEKAKKLFRQKAAKLIATTTITAATIAGQNLISNQEESPQKRTIASERATHALITESPLTDIVGQQAEQQKNNSEKQEIKAKKEKKKKPTKKADPLVNALANEADKDSPTNKKQLKNNIKTILDSLKEEKIATPRVIAYALATVETETGDTYKPVREAYYMDKATGAKPGTNGEKQAIANGYSGGKDYYGRGYVQITHDYNYDKFDTELNLDGKLANNPDTALNPEIAGDILAAFFKVNGVAEKAETNFIAARQPINGADKAPKIAQDAETYLQAIKNA